MIGTVIGYRFHSEMKKRFINNRGQRKKKLIDWISRYLMFSFKIQLFCAFVNEFVYNWKCKYSRRTHNIMYPLQGAVQCTERSRRLSTRLSHWLQMAWKMLHGMKWPTTSATLDFIFGTALFVHCPFIWCLVSFIIWMHEPNQRPLMCSHQHTSWQNIWENSPIHLRSAVLHYDDDENPSEK